jgi:hypothetical protein
MRQIRGFLFKFSYQTKIKQIQYTIFDADSNKSSKWYIFKNTTELGAIY